MELVTEAVDDARGDLAEAVAAEELLDVAEPPLVVIDRVRGEPELLGEPPSFGEHPEALVDRDAEVGHRRLESILVTSPTPVGPRGARQQRGGD